VEVNKLEKGYIHLYYGDGKGKTTTSMGLAIRAAGYGMKVLIYQFMKNNKTSERAILSTVSNITIIDGLEEEKFSFQMTEEEKQERRIFYTNRFLEITEKASNENYDLLIMDEIIYTLRANLLEEEIVLDFLKNKPANLEVVLTGNSPSDKLIELSDYASEIKKVKHPFEMGVPARFGIEK
jgi:cob(I)alamin adenosyltransferase